MATAMYWLFSFKRIMKNVLLLWRIIYPFAIDHLLYASFIMYKKAVLRKPEGVMFAYLYGDTYTTLSVWDRSSVNSVVPLSTSYDTSFQMVRY